MNIEISKTIGYDFFRQSGEDVLFKSLCETPSGQRADVVRSDLTTLLSQALNHLAGDSTGGGKAPAHIARLIGYLQGLGEMVELVSIMGATFEAKARPDGTSALVMHIPSLNSAHQRSGLQSWPAKT